MSTGCANNQSLTIPVFDDDGDVVKCRCSTNICLSGLSIDVEKCIIFFNPLLGGYYTIEISIEDYDANGKQLSSIPLQFIAFVQSNTAFCCK